MHGGGRCRRLRLSLRRLRGLWLCRYGCAFGSTFGRRRLAMGVRAVFVAAFSAGLLGSLFRFAFGEGCGLPLDAAFEEFEALLEFADVLFEPRITLAELLIFAEEFLIGRRVHANLEATNRVSCMRF